MISIIFTADCASTHLPSSTSTMSTTVESEISTPPVITSDAPEPTLETPSNMTTPERSATTVDTDHPIEDSHVAALYAMFPAFDTAVL